MTEFLDKVRKTPLTLDVAVAQAKLQGLPESGWGVLKHEGGLEHTTTTTTLLEVRREEEKAQAIADQLQESQGVSQPYESDPDAGPAFFRSFGVAKVALRGADVVTTLHYEMIDDLTGLAQELGIADSSMELGPDPFTEGETFGRNA